MLHLMLVMMQSNTLYYKEGKICSFQRGTAHSVLRPSQDKMGLPLNNAMLMNDLGVPNVSSFFFFVFEIAKFCFFVVVPKTHPCYACSSFGVENTMYCITEPFL